MFVWVITGNSESGDHFGPFVYDYEPSEAEKRYLIKHECDWYDDDGPGDYGAYTYLTVTKTEIRHL